MITVQLLDKPGLRWAQETVTAHHYLRRPVDSRCSVEGYAVTLAGERIGLLLFGRPEATRCADWYGSVDDVAAGRCKVTRWQVLNLARVWLDPCVQRGGALYGPDHLPGFVDRRGVWRSALASTVIKLAAGRISFDYLMRRPPCFLEEPYHIRWLLSYCDTRLHRGTVYQESGFHLYRTNERGIQTWRVPLPGLTPQQDAAICEVSERHPRSIQYRARRAQIALAL